MESGGFFIFIKYNKEKFPGEAARSHDAHLKTNCCFSHKFSFSKIWSSLNFNESQKTSWNKSFFEKNKLMAQGGLELTTSCLWEWSLSAFCHTDSCFPIVKIRNYKNKPLFIYGAGSLLLSCCTVLVRWFSNFPGTHYK